MHKIIKMITKEDIKNAERLVGEDGLFKSNFPHGEKEYSFGYVDELCEYVACLADISDEEKLDTVLKLEDMLRRFLKGDGTGVNFIPTWSTKLLF